MPSALETLVKILKLEREQGANDSAVIGGLASFGQNWVKDAHEQARIPEHHLLVDELVQLMGTYAAEESRTRRMEQIQYMLDRITGRVPPPPEFQVQESAETAPSKAEPASEAEPPPQPVEAQQSAPRRESGPREQKQETQKRDRKPEARDRKSESRDRGRKSEREGRREGSHRDHYDGGDEGRPPHPDLPPEPRLARPPRQPRPDMDPEEAADILRGLHQPVTVVKGVGERMAESFERLGVHTLQDLLYFLPRRYDDYRKMSLISNLPVEQVATVIGTVRTTSVQVRDQKRRDFKLTLDDGTGLLDAVFFGQHFMGRYIKTGDQIVLSGKTSIYRQRLQMTNPEWEHLDTDNLHTVGIVPVYPLTEGLKARGLRRLMHRAVTYWAERLPDYVPVATLDRAELADLGWAIQQIHFPEGEDHLRHARRRMAFDSLLLLQLAILANRREWQRVPSYPLAVDDDYLTAFLQAVFPYTLTGAQQKAIADIRRDVAETIPMNRLLQGDVGSGKTAVAITALAAGSGKRQTGRDHGPDQYPGRAALPQRQRSTGEDAGRDCAYGGAADRIADSGRTRDGARGPGRWLDRRGRRHARTDPGRR